VANLRPSHSGNHPLRRKRPAATARINVNPGSRWYCPTLRAFSWVRQRVFVAYLDACLGPKRAKPISVLGVRTPSRIRGLRLDYRQHAAEAGLRVTMAIYVPIPTTDDMQRLKDLQVSYEFWMSDANATGSPRGLLAPCSARAIAEHALNEYHEYIERFILG
jgi:hypothetical protein